MRDDERLVAAHASRHAYHLLYSRLIRHITKLALLSVAKYFGMMNVASSAVAPAQLPRRSHSNSTLGLNLGQPAGLPRTNSSSLASAQCRGASELRTTRSRMPTCNAATWGQDYPSSSYRSSSSSSSSSSPPASLPNYSAPGPCRTAELTPISVRVGGDNELPVMAQLQVTVPLTASGAPAPCSPLVVLSPGFLLNASLYRSYAQDLASWGYAVALYDLNELMDDTQTVAALGKVVDACLTQPQLKSQVDPGCIILAGHSRGGKLSCLAAAKDTRIKALLLLDPVDVTPMTPPGEGYPSCLAGLRAATSGARQLPVLVVGAAQGGDVIPASGNYKRFSAVCAGPLWEVDLLGSAHLSFLDKQVGLLSMFSQPGTTSDASVRAASKVAMLTWLAHTTSPSMPPAAATAAGLQVTEAVAAASRQISQITFSQAKVTVQGLDQVASRQGSKAQSQQQQQQQQQAAGGGQRIYQQQQQTQQQAGDGVRAGARASSQQSSGRSNQTSSGGQLSYEDLMQGYRAKELKAMLLERGIKCDDCFEKEQLARRLVESRR
ncbi:Alpha/Beta hydrolase protein [Haematococcus lacustris]